MLVGVFDTENKAYEGEKALLQLDREGSLTVYAHAVLAKKADGTTVVLQGDDPGPIGTLLGTTWGALIGLLGGPVGVAVGAGAGLVAGSVADLGKLRLGSDFIEDVTKQLQPNRVAVVAEIDEDWTTPVDTRIEAIGGTVIRRSLSEVEEKIHDEHVAAMEADLAQMKAERAQAHADHKAKLEKKIGQLEAKLQAQLQNSKEKREASQREAMAKVEALKAKAAAAKAIARS
jgi:uncharacterized membrane protein